MTHHTAFRACLTAFAALAALFLSCLPPSASFAASAAAPAASPATSPAPAGGPAFKIGIELPNQVPVSKAVEAGLRQLGISYVNFYTTTFPTAHDAPQMTTYRALSDLCRRLGLDFSLACHVYDPADDVVKAAVAYNSDPKRTGTFRGIVFDELAHIRLLNFSRPTALADYKSFRTLPQAYDDTVAGFGRLRAKFQALGAPVVATHVFPVLLHAAARAGFTPCPKICKEEYSTVALATGMGAAKEYGRPLWADCDLWFYDLLPGHPPEVFRSNLLLAYWLGADVVYVEGAGYNLLPAGSQGTPFSLLNQISPTTCQLTPDGQILRWFCRDYLPAHPRPWSIRDLRPDVALICYDDSDYGQHWLSGFTRGLFGTDALPSTPDTRSVFSAWDLLTFGVTGDDGLTHFKPSDAAWGYAPPRVDGIWPSYLTRPLAVARDTFWVPLNGVAVYDQLVGYDLLKNIPLLVVAGPDLSAKTMAAIRRRVSEGATCVIWGPLARRKGLGEGWTSGVQVIKQGAGKFVLTDDFRLPEVVQQVWPFIGHPDTIRYRFGDHVVELRRVTDNKVQVSVDGHPAGP